MEDLSPHDQVIIDKILNMEEDSQEALITSSRQQQFKTEGANNLQLCSENQVSNNNVQIINNTPTCSTSNTGATIDIQTTNSGLPKDLRHLKMDGFSDLVNEQDNKPVVSEVTVSFVYCTPSNQPQHVYTSSSQISPVQMPQGDNILCTTSPSSNQTSIHTLLEQQKQIQTNLHIMSQRHPTEAPLLTFVNTSQSESSFKTPLTITTTNNNHNNVQSVNQTPNLPTSDSEQNMESDANVLQSQNDKSMLHQLLTSPDGYLTGSNDFNNASSPETASSPDYHPADSPSSLSSPASIVQHDPNTQSTLIVNAGRLHLDSESGNEEISFHGLWQETMHGDEEPNKVGQTQIDTEQPSLIVAPAVDKVFDPDGVNSTFTFTMFGSDQQAFFGTDRKSENTAAAVKTIPETVSSIDGEKERHEMPPPKSIPTTRSQTHSKRVKEPSLNQHFPWKVHGYELRILDQPEEQHRARYLTEGSRGAVKNRSQEGHPVVKLFGPTESAALQVFIGNDSGKVKPHGFYQACKVCGKNSTPAREKDIDGTTVIEMDLTPVSDMSASVDNVGILKLRNADVEQRIGLTKAKKKSVKARMIFRAVFRKADGNMQTLQIASNSILCTQPIGQPEVCKMSRSESSVAGKGELFLIGKNFMKGTKVFFQEVKGEENETIWEKEAEIDKDYFQPTHLICTIPPYKDINITSPVNIQIIVQSSGKMSDPQHFTFLPDTGKQETPMETQEVSQKRKLSFSVSPEALELNQQIQHTSGMFQLPPGTISTANMTGVTNMQVDSVVSISASMDKDIKPVSPVLDNAKPTFSPDETETDSKPLNVMTSIGYDTKPIQITSLGGIPSVVPATSMEQGVLSVSHNFQQTKRCTSPIKQNTSCSAALLQAVEEMKSLQRSTAVQQNIEQDQHVHRQPSNPDLQQHFLTPQAVEMAGMQEALLNHLVGGKFLQQQELQQLPAQQQQPMVVSSIPQLPILREHLTTDTPNMGSGVKTEIPMAVISPSSVSVAKETMTGAFTSLQAMTASPMTVQSSMGTQQIMTSGSQSPMATILPSSLAFSQFTQTQQVVSHIEPPKDVKPAVSMSTNVMSSSGAFASPVSGAVSGQVSRQQQAPVPQIIICGGAGQANNLNGVIPQPTPQTVQPPPPQPPQPTVQQQSQQPAPLGPSIFILPGGGAGGANAQVENLLRSILGSLQPTQQPQS